MEHTQQSKIRRFLTSPMSWLYIWMAGTPVLLLASTLTNPTYSAYLAFDVQLPWLAFTMVLGAAWTLRAHPSAKYQ